MKRRRFVLACSAAASVAVLQARAQTSMPIVPDVNLLDEQGRTMKLRTLVAERTVAINFIYTGCASFCPPQTAVFRAVQSRLNELSETSAAKYAPLLLSLSIDPLNDTPQTLARYASRFEAKLGLEKKWLMLTGEPAALEQAARAFSASTSRVDDHPTQLWVGCAPKSRWLNAKGLASADDVLRMMKAAAA